MTRRDLPPELLGLLHAIDACEREAEAIVADMSEEEVNWQEHPGQTWSVGQCLDHLAKINALYVPGFLNRVEQAKQRGVGPFRGLSPTAGGRWFIRQNEPPVKRRIKAVRSVVPRSTVSRDEVVEAYKRSHDPYRALVEAADVDVNKVKGPNPFFPIIPMRISTVLLVVPAHDRRHLWQAANVKRELRGG